MSALPEWARPDTDSLAKALVLAEHQAHLTQRSQIVMASVDNGEMGFTVTATENYAALREKGLHERYAPLCSVLPNGDIDVYEVVGGFLTGTPRDRP